MGNTGRLAVLITILVLGCGKKRDEPTPTDKPKQVTPDPEAGSAPEPAPAPSGSGSSAGSATGSAAGVPATKPGGGDVIVSCMVKKEKQCHEETMHNPNVEREPTKKRCVEINSGVYEENACPTVGLVGTCTKVDRSRVFYYKGAADPKHDC